MFCLLVKLKDLVPSANVPLPLYKTITRLHNTTICRISQHAVLKEIKHFDKYATEGYTDFDALKSVYEIIQDSECLSCSVQCIDKPKLKKHRKRAYDDDDETSLTYSVTLTPVCYYKNPSSEYELKKALWGYFMFSKCCIHITMFIETYVGLIS